MNHELSTMNHELPAAISHF